MNNKEYEKFEKIGEGKCANIYKSGNNVYKILKENTDSKKFYSKEMLQQLVGIKNDLCVFPNEILEDANENLIGYSMDFVNCVYAYVWLILDIVNIETKEGSRKIRTTSL